LLQVVHSAVKGRIRYKYKGLYRCEPLKEFLQKRLSNLSFIKESSINTYTSSILIIHNIDINPTSIQKTIQDIIDEYVKSSINHSINKAIKSNNGITLAKSNSNSKLLKKKIKSRQRLRLEIEKAEIQPSEDWYLRDSREVIKFFSSSPSTGLNQKQVQENLKRFGPNVLPEAVPRSGLSILWDQLNSLPMILLAMASAVSALTGGISDALVILGVVAINTTIGYITESQSEKTIYSLKSLVRPSCHVLRSSKIIETSADDIVPGDILVLRPGSYISADARLIEANHLTVDESALTGESMPVHKVTDVIAISNDTKNIPIAERTNLVYMGTLVTGGQGLAIVTNTGKYTEIGKIQILAGQAKPPETPMERQLNYLGNQLVLICGGICGLVFLMGLLRGYGLIEMLKTAISLAIAAIPEGLPTVATTTLALGIRNMRRHNVLMRHLNAVETLGSVQTICLDKTGTVTLNKMTVVSIFAGMQRINVNDGLFFCSDENINPYNYEEILRMLYVCVLCNESIITENGNGYVLNGSPTENALLQTAISVGIDVNELRRRHPMISITHRSENKNYMTSIHETTTKKRIIAIKGSPREVLSLCDCHIVDNIKKALTDEDRIKIENQNDIMASEALRLLGVAINYLEDEDITVVKEGYVWLGLIGMTDPIRTGTKELISKFHNAGIDTVMITGDQSLTAYAIAKELNLSHDRQLEIIDSSNFMNLDKEVMRALFENVNVFSRVSPAHKLQIVQALQSTGKVVAMTGDGINDGPALKTADIGIAMGHTGTDVAREVADVILEDDNLETMIVAISQGRTIYNNIRKSVHFLLSTNLSEIMVMFSGIALNIGQPLTPIQLLWINLISDIAPGLALALEPPEPDIMNIPPRDPKKPIVTNQDLKRVTFESAMLSAGALSAYGYGIARYGQGQNASTIAFMSLTMGQLIHSLSCRSEKHNIFESYSLPNNKYLTGSLLISFTMQGLALFVPALRSLLGIGLINPIDGLIIGGSAIIPFLINESTK